MKRFARWLGGLLLLSLLVAGCGKSYIERKRADQYFERKMYEEAVAEYNEVLTIEGPSYRVYFQLGESFRGLKDHKEACRHFELAREQAPLTPGSHERLGECYARLEQWDKSKASWEKFLELSPGDLKANRELAEIYLKEQRYDKAEAHYRAYLEVKPDDIHIRSALGAMLSAQEKYHAAVRELSLVVETKPSYISGHYNLGVALLGANENERALVKFIVVTEMSPGFMDGWICLAATYCRLGNPLSAIEALERAKKHGFSDWQRIDGDSDFRHILEHERYQALKASPAPEAAKSAAPMEEYGTE